jgi:hypothetical protein
MNVSQGYEIGNADGEGTSWYFWELIVVSRKIAIIIISVRLNVNAVIMKYFMKRSFVRNRNHIVFIVVLKTILIRP